MSMHEYLRRIAMPTCEKCGHSMLPDYESTGGVGDLIRLEASSYAAYIVGGVIWFFAAAVCSSFLPVPAAGVAGVVVAVAVVIYLIRRNTTHFRCPNCGTFKEHSEHAH